MTKKIKYLVIHCTATPEYMPISSDMIRAWHLNNNGWRQVGYSGMIHLNGYYETLVPFDDDDFIAPWEITNGVRGINAVSRHIVYVGGCQKSNPKKAKDTRTPAQYKRLAEFVKEQTKAHPHIQIAGHNQFSNKACPSFDVPTFCREIGLAEKNIYQ